MSEIQINQFNLNSMVRSPNIIIIGKRGTGKTWLCNDLAHTLNIPMKIIISPTEHIDPFYSNIYPDAIIHNEYTSSIGDSVITRQSDLKRKIGQKQLNDNSIDMRLLLIMDDCLALNKTWAYDEYMREIIMNGRFYDITCIMIMQFPLGIGPEIRCQFDYIFMFYDDHKNNLKRLYGYYAGMFPTFSSFCEVFEQLTKDYNSMVINNRGSARNFNEKIYQYCANHPKTIMTDVSEKLDKNITTSREIVINI